MWSTDAAPTQILGDEDEGNRILRLRPAERRRKPFHNDGIPARQRADGLHHTDTVDYVICIAGQIDMFVDDTQFVTLRAGDVLIQRGPITRGKTVVISPAGSRSC